LMTDMTLSYFIYVPWSPEIRFKIFPAPWRFCIEVWKLIFQVSITMQSRFKLFEIKFTLVITQGGLIDLVMITL